MMPTRLNLRRKIKEILTSLALICILSNSCKEGQDENQLGKKTDSFAVKPNAPKSAQKKMPPLFDQFQSAFKKDSTGKIDSNRQIPISTVDSFLATPIDTQFNTSINPIEWISNTYGYFSIIRINCNAGGECATYRLIEFNKEGIFVKSTQIGMLAADESDIEYFKYDILSDTLIRVYKIDHDIESGKTSKSVKLVKLNY